MFAAAFQPVAQVSSDLATKAGTTLIESGILGSLLVASVLGNIALIWLLVKVQNLRVADTKAIAIVSEKMVTTFGNVESALRNLHESNKTLSTMLNTVLMSALSRSGAPPHTLPPGSIT